MHRCAVIALELPGPDLVTCTALLLHHGVAVAEGLACAGRLLRPRRLRRELEALLTQHLRGARAQAEDLRARQPFQAHQLVAAAKGWARRVRRQHLAPHRLRLQQPDRLHCWRIPACYHRALLAQLSAAPGTTPSKLHVRFLVPVTERLRLGEPWELAVYLHAPCRYATGPWTPVPLERVRARLEGWTLVVEME